MAGRYDFLVTWLCFGGSVRLKWWEGLYLNFYFLQFVVNCLGGRICAVGLLPSIFFGIL